MKVGYARTSTVSHEAGLEAQIKELESAGCDRIFYEQASSIAKRNELDLALNFVREGDIFVITKIDRLARSVPDLMQFVEDMHKRNVTFIILNLGMDTSTPTGKLMLTMLAAVAQFEREIMLERQREGIAKARAEGKFKGRKQLPKELKDLVMTYVNGGLAKSWISRKVGIAESSIYRIINESKQIRMCNE